MWNIWRRKRNGEIEVEQDTGRVKADPEAQLLQDIKNMAEKCGMQIKLIPLTENCKSYFERVISYLLDDYSGWGKKPSLEEYLRYFFMKAMEYQVANDLYGDTNAKREGVFDVFLSPDEICEENFRTNLPFHLDKRIKKDVGVIEAFAKKVREYMDVNPDKTSFEVIMSVVNVGFSYSDTMKISEISIKDYNNKDLLTVNEIRKRGVDIAADILYNSGFTLYEVNFMLDSYVSIRLNDGEKEICAFADVQVYPERNYFLPREFNHLILTAEENHAEPYYLCVSVASQNEKHYEDGVLLADDKVIGRINAFESLKEDKQSH